LLTGAARATNAPMITGLDHVAIGVRDWHSSLDQYVQLLGSPASALAEVAGQRAALFELSNTRILLLDGAEAEGVLALGLATADLQAALLQLTAARMTGAVQVSTTDQPAQLAQLPAERTRGLPVRLCERPSRALSAADSFGHDRVEALDHVVVRSADPDHAVGLYRDALGIRLALDRSLLGTRMLFFRTGAVTLELIADLSPQAGAAADSFYGLAYRVRDLEQAHARLSAAGFELSEPRVGRKAGTRVFSVRSCGVPTLFIRDASRD
jgi:catechol 2,3-dioxygenase-like lactoylglutathione lyase family enzyme